MYIDPSTQSAGDNAKLQLSVSRSNSSSCLTFYYHMYGGSMRTLNVYNGNVIIFSKSGSQGNRWRKETKTVQLSDIVSTLPLLRIIANINQTFFMRRCCSRLNC